MRKLIVFAVVLGNLLSAAHGASFELIERMKLNPDNYKTTRVFGFSHQDVLSFDGDPKGSACSESHKQNDLSNRWCHALYVKIADEKLRDLGVPKTLSALASASIFLPKEYLIDKNPSPADLMIAEYSLYEFDDDSGKIALSLFGDGATILSLEKTF